MVGWMTKKIHNYHFGQWPEMPWKENKMETFKLALYEKALQIASEDIYKIRVLYEEAKGDFVLASMIRDDKEDWIENRINNWLERAKE